MSFKRHKFLERGDYNDACFRAKSIIRGLKKDFDIDTIRYAFKSVLDEEGMKESTRSKSKRVKEAVGYNGDFWKNIMKGLKDIFGEGIYNFWDGRNVEGYWSYNKGFVEVKIPLDMGSIYYDYFDEKVLKNKDWKASKSDDIETALKKYIAYSVDSFLYDKKITLEEFFEDYEYDFTGSGYLLDDAPYFIIKFIHEDGSMPQHLKNEDDEEQCIYAFCDLCYGYDTTMSEVFNQDIIFTEADGEEKVKEEILKTAKDIYSKIDTYLGY